jgi:hypothetical protein
MRRDELPVEPLSEATWQRIERRVFEEVNHATPRADAHAGEPRRKRIVLALIAAAVALQLAALAFWMRSPARDAPALASTRLVTDRVASETLLDDIAVHLEPASALVVVDDAEGGSLVVLERGAVRFSVPPRARRPAFVVQAGEARVEVVGTRFRVERVDGSARVDTYEGTVRVIARGRVTLLPRGAHWSESAPGGETDAGAALLLPEPKRPNPTSEATSTPAPAELPASDARQAGRAATDRVQAATEAPRASSPLPGRSKHVPAAGRPAARDRDRQRFEEAALLEASAPRRALELYGHLVAEAGPWGAPALYAMARLELELGERTSASDHLRRYLARHPRGSNAAEVKSLLGTLDGAAE